MDGDPVWIRNPNSDDWRLELPPENPVTVQVILAGTTASGMPLYAVLIEGPCGSGFVSRKEGDDHGGKWTLQGAMRKAVKYGQDDDWLRRHGVI